RHLCLPQGDIAPDNLLQRGSDVINRVSAGQRDTASRSVSVRNCGDPIAADPPGGWGGWGLGKPDRTVWPTARLSGAGTPITTYDDGFPKAPPTPPALAAVLTVGSTRDLKRLRAPNLPTTRWLEFGRDRRSIPRESFDARLCGRAPRGGRERRVGLRKPVVVRSDRRP